MKNIVILTVALLISAISYSQSNVQLNNGERWQVNPEITKSVQSMQAKISSFEKGEYESKADFHFSLMEDFQNLFTQNTMEGEAHQQMVNFAMPIRMQLVHLDQCAEAPCKEEVKAIKESLAEYSTYFK